MKRAWIVANGVSLSKTPLYALHERGEVSFAMNEIELLYNRTKWRPTHYVRTDGNIGPWLGSTAYHILNGEKCFISRTIYREVSRLLPFDEIPDNVSILNLCEHQDMDITHPDKPMGWHFPSYCAFGGGVSVAIQVAVNLGFTEVYLVGVDLGYDKPQNVHFDSAYGMFDPLGMNPRRDETLTYVHRFIHRDTPGLGVRVMDATVDGPLGVYPMTTVTDVLNEAIVVPGE